MLEIQKVEGNADLFHQYPLQMQSQPCFLELSEGGTVCCDWDGEIGGGVPCTVWSRRDLRWDIPCLPANMANKLMEELLQLLERVHAGHTVEWDGSNMSGSLDEDAQDASEEIDEHIRNIDHDEFLRVSDADDWFQDYTPDITAETTDEEITAIAASEVETARDAGIHVLRGIEEYLENLRDNLGSVTHLVECRCP